MATSEHDKRLRAELAAELGWYPADLDDESIARQRADAARDDNSGKNCGKPCSHPKTAPVMEANQLSASRASLARTSCGASTRLMTPVPSASL